MVRPVVAIYHSPRSWDHPPDDKSGEGVGLEQELSLSDGQLEHSAACNP